MERTGVIGQPLLRPADRFLGRSAVGIVYDSTHGGGLLGNVLHANESRTIAARTQPIQQMPAAIIQRKSAVCARLNMRF
jgi:hypothetical protein